MNWKFRAILTEKEKNMQHFRGKDAYSSIKTNAVFFQFVWFVCLAEFQFECFFNAPWLLRYEKKRIHVRKISTNETIKY